MKISARFVLLSFLIWDIGLVSMEGLAQNASLYPIAKQTFPMPANALDRGFEKTSEPTLEVQQTCPQPYGDAWDTTSEQVWNVLEFGIQVKPDQLPRPKLQAYSRYTCNRPLERPIAGR